MSVGDKTKSVGKAAAIGIVVLFIAALAYRDPHGFGHAAVGFGSAIVDAFVSLWHVITGIASGT